MSTLLENNIFSLVNVLCGKYLVVPSERLGDLVKRVRESKNMSLQDVRRKSERQLAASYISRIENGQIDPVAISVGKLVALAKGIEMPEGALFDIARGAENKSVSPEKAELTAIIGELNPNRINDLLEMARVFYRFQSLRDEQQEDRVEPARKSFRINSSLPVAGELHDETRPVERKRRKAAK